MRSRSWRIIQSTPVRRGTHSVSRGSRAEWLEVSASDDDDDDESPTGCDADRFLSGFCRCVVLCFCSFVCFSRFFGARFLVSVKSSVVVA